MNLELLEQMTRINAVVGNEQPLAAWLAEQVAAQAGRVEQDRLGNLFAWRGPSPKVAIFCHMDSVGFIVESVHEDHVKVLKLGGPTTPAHTPMVVETAAGELIPGTLVTEEKTIRIDLYDPAAVERVRVGDIAAFAPSFRADEERVQGRWLDNRLGCWVALGAWRACDEALFVATVREEHAPPGAGAAARYAEGIEIALVVDITYAASPGAPYMIEWGKGPAVTLRDAQVHDRRWARRLLDLAAEHDLPAQCEIAAGGGSDAMHISRAGIPAIFVGLPIRYAHTPAEIGRLDDCRVALDLITKFVAAYQGGRWEASG